MSVIQFIRRTLSLDYRSLALYRFLMGLVVVADVLYRLRDLTNFYTDLGLIPRNTFISEMSTPWSFSLHLANGSLGFAILMFTLHLIFGLMLVFGYKTRWAMIGAYIMTVSVHNRNWLVNNGGDDILRAILFISIFLPLNKYFSVDSALRKEKENLGSEYFSTWGLTFFFQVFAIYFVSYILKDSPIWRVDYTALFFASRLDIFATSIGVWMRNFPLLQKIITIYTIYLEWLGPLILISSAILGRNWWKGRMLTVIGFWALHLGIILNMTIGIFPYLCIAMWFIFIPTPLWGKLMMKIRNKGYGKVKIYYDAECGFCQKGVRLIREFFLLPEVEILEAQSKKDIHEHMLKNNSWVVVNENGDKFCHFSAWIELMRHSPVMWWKVPFWNLRPIFYLGNKIYYWVSNHRPFMGKFTQFLQYATPKKKIALLRWCSEILGGGILVTLFMWNLTTIKNWDVKAPTFQNITRWLHLYQEWNMFAPYPKMDNIWAEIPATLSDDSEIELITGDRDIYSIKDQKFYQSIPNEHWRKFYLNLSEKPVYSKYYGAYFCRLWNERNMGWVEQKLIKMEIIVYSQRNLIDGSKGPINRKMSWRHSCFEGNDNKENP